jgi:hypothetical protein
LAVLGGIDFFTVEVLSWRGLVTYIEADLVRRSVIATGAT